MRDMQTPPSPEENDSLADPPEADPGESPKNALERLYDKIPVTLKQVDFFIKLMLALLAAVLIFAIVNASGF